MILVFDFVAGYRSHMGQLFNPTAFDLSMNYSFITIAANFANIIFVVLTLAIIVEKANRCLDFTLTVFIIHLLLTCVVYKFPNTFNWWATHGILITVTVLTSEFVCLKLET